MDDLNTIARPYAQAALAQAREEDALASWSEQLAFLAAAVRDPTLAGIIADPRVGAERLLELFKSLGDGRLTPTGTNFVRLLVENNRLAALPQIAAQFEAAKAAMEGRKQIEVTAARALTKKQREELTKSLANRLGYEVELNVSKDAALLGGVIIRAGDLVIDASLRGRLARLGNALGVAA